MNIPSTPGSDIIMSTTLLSYYEAIEKASADMLEAARTGDWDAVVKLEGACAVLIAQLKNAAQGSQLARNEAKEKSRIMQRILLNDAEIPCVINAIFARIGIGEFVIRINNRKLLQGYLLDQGLTAEGVGAALKVIDAIEKVSRERTVADLSAQAGIDAATAERIVDLVTRPVTIADLRAIEGGELYREGLDELGQVADGLAAFQVPAHHVTPKPLNMPL